MVWNMFNSIKIEFDPFFGPCNRKRMLEFWWFWWMVCIYYAMKSSKVCIGRKVQISPLYAGNFVMNRMWKLIIYTRCIFIYYYLDTKLLYTYKFNAYWTVLNLEGVLPWLVVQNEVMYELFSFAVYFMYMSNS